MEYTDIIMPAYNCEKYIKYAIESVKQQTNKNWKLIIIDDCSTDNTIKEIQDNTKDIQEKVELIQLNKHVGVANARNEGIKKSENKYIAFLDSDDIWKKDKLEKQVNFMKNNDYGFTYTLYTYLKGEHEKRVKIFPVSLDYEKALKNTFILTSTVMIDKTKINIKYIQMPNVESEDTATWWNILKNKNTAYGLKEDLVTYRITKNGLSSNKIKNLKRTWNLYRKQEKLPILKSIFCFISYIFHAIRKRV